MNDSQTRVTRRSDRTTLKIFDPDKSNELLLGWQLHACRRRVIHERAGRSLQTWSYVLGVPTVLLAAAAGSSAFVAWQSDTANHTAALIGGAVGLAAAILASVQTFLDLGARAERHRQAAVDFKKILRTFERIPSSAGDLRSIKDDSEEGRVLLQLEAALMEADRRAPVVPKRLGETVEAMPVDVVRQAEKLAPPKVVLEAEPEPVAPNVEAPKADGGSAPKVEPASRRSAKLAPANAD